MPITVTDTATIADAYIEAIGNDSVIQTEAPGGVWNEMAEQGTTGRLIRYAFQRMAGGYEGFNHEIVYEVLVYLVTMVGENDRFEDLRVGASRIKQLLHRERGDAVNEADVTLGKVLWSRYVGLHKERMPVEGQWFPELGGVFELAVQPPISV